MKAYFEGDIEKHVGLRRNISYDIDFRSDGHMVLVDVMVSANMEFVGTYIFLSMKDFLQAWGFPAAPRSSRVRAHTNFETTLWFTVSEVAELFGVARNTVLKWDASGYLTAERRVGKRGDRRFSREQCMAMLKERHDGQ